MSTKKAKILRLDPAGSTLADAAGKPIAVGDLVEEGCALVLSTPDGSSGAVSMSARIDHTVRSKQLPPVEPPPEVAAADTPRQPGRFTDPGLGRPLPMPIAIKPIS